jgi:hypothetical protein
MSEPIIIPRDYEHITPWFDVIRHANRVIVTGSLQWLEIGVFIDADGKPQFWEIEQPRTLSPKRREVTITG